MEPINPLGFPAPFAPPLIWIFSVINKCKFRLCMYSEKYFSTMLWHIESFTKFETDLFSLTCTYCIWIMLVCQISCFVWEAIKTTLTWLDLTQTGLVLVLLCHCRLVDRIEENNKMVIVGLRLVSSQTRLLPTMTLYCPMVGEKFSLYYWWVFTLQIMGEYLH